MLKKISLALTATGFYGFLVCLLFVPAEEITIGGVFLSITFAGLYLYCWDKIWGKKEYEWKDEISRKRGCKREA